MKLRLYMFSLPASLMEAHAQRCFNDIPQLVRN